MGMHAAHLASTEEALELAGTLKDPLLLSADLRDLSSALAADRRMDRSVEEARNALAMVAPLHNDTAWVNCSLFLMDALQRADRHEEAIDHGFKALKRIDPAGMPIYPVRLRMALARAMIERERYVDARPFLTANDMEVLLEQDTVEAVAALMLKARMFIGLGDLRMAADRAERAESLTALRSAGTSDQAIMQVRYALAKAERRWEEALRLLEALRQHEDSLHKAHDDLKLAGLQVVHEVKRAEKANVTLSDLNGQYAESIADLRSSNRLLLAALVVAMVLAIALFVAVRKAMYMQARLRLKNEVVRRQHDELHAKNLELERRHLRLAESLLNEEEQETIIKEIHHRVKNDLQVVDSLLGLEGSLHQDTAVQRSFKDARSRLRSMAMVHEHLYRSAGRTRSSLHDHLNALARMLLVKHGLHDRVSVSVSTVEPGFGAETLIPLTLLVNELLTNSMKHAFHERVSGHMDIVLKDTGDGYLLRFTDDGPGMPALGRQEGFGLHLLEVLARQLNGEVSVEHGPGTVYCMRFRTDSKLGRLAS